MAKVHTIARSNAYVMEQAEQGNHLVTLKGWTGVASHVVDDAQNVEGTLVWFPSVRVVDLTK